jgi:HEAT repeat protein
MPLVRADLPDDPAPSERACDRAALLDGLQAPASAERRSAARGLVAYPDATVALCARLGAEPAPSVRNAILTSLIALRSDAAVRGLLPYLRSEDAGLRNAVVAALQRMPGALETHVQALLRDTDADVRIFAVNVLAAHPHKLAQHWLLEVLRQDPHVNVCAAAVEGLAGLGDRTVGRALAGVVARFPEEPFIAFAVQTALRRTGAL